MGWRCCWTSSVFLITWNQHQRVHIHYMCRGLPIWPTHSCQCIAHLSVLHPATTHPWPSKCCSLPIQKQCCTISPETVFHSIARKCIALSVVHHHSFWMNSREGNVTSGKLDMTLWELNRTVLWERKSWNNITNRKASPRFYCMSAEFIRFKSVPLTIW